MRPGPLLVTRQITHALLDGLTSAENPLTRRLRIAGSFTASGVRLSAGMMVSRALGTRPVKRLRLWDFERCPHSRIVREALSVLDLDAEVRPCPRGGTRFRPELISGRVPQLEDPNTGQTIVGSVDIVSHLHAHYGSKSAPWLLNLTPVRLFTGLTMVALTGGRGARARPSKLPEQPLELWSFEASPYSRMVRETLCELELPYVLHNVAKGSPRRDDFIARAGKMQVPYLEDPNTGAKLFESQTIERYLEDAWGKR